MMEPTPEQLAEWLADAGRALSVRHPAPLTREIAGEVARLAYAAGADAQMEKCLKALREDVLTKENLFGAGIGSVNSYSWQEFARMVCIQLRSTCRPDPPSLKQRALELLASHEDGWTPSQSQWIIIRCAIESLPDP
jgi:hypothetical protein